MSGLQASEQLVMDLWDGGRSIEQIVAQTGMPRVRVANYVANYDVRHGEDRDREAAIRIGSARYAAALAATGRIYA